MSTILNYTKGLIKEHHLAIIFFFIVGFISVAPQILSIRALGNDYQGIHFIYIDDEVTYMTAIRDILDGHWLSGSPFFYEYKYLKSVVLPWGNYFYALPTLITGFSLVNILIISKFLFPAGLFILIYLLIKKLIGDGGNNFLVKISAVSGGLFATLGYDLLDYKWAWSFLSGKIMDVHLLIWTRPVNPITGALLVFIFLLSTWSIINKRRPIYAILTTGLLLGLMTYYFFSWGIAAAILGSLIAVCLFRKKYREAVALTAIGIINFLVSLPFWFNVLKNIGSTGGNKQMERMGMFFTHVPVINKILFATALFFIPSLIYEFLKRKKEGTKIEDWWWFCLALLLGGVVVFNQQVVTGRTIWYYHFVQYTIPLSIVILIVWLFNFVRPKLRILSGTIICVIALASLAIGIRTAFSYVYVIDDFRRLQNYGYVINWLNKNAPQDCVVLVKEEGEELVNLIPAFTHCNVYVSPWVFEGVPEDRNYHNYLTLLRIRGVEKNAVHDYLVNHQLEVRDYFFNNWNEHFSKVYDSSVDKEIATLDARYQIFIKEDFGVLLKKFRLNYIVAAGDLKETVKKQLLGLQYIDNSNALYIYKFNPRAE